MNDIRFVWFDLDDTLLDHRGAEEHALAALVTHHAGLFGDASLSDIREQYARINRIVWSEYAAGQRDKEGAKYGRFELLLRCLNVSDLDRAIFLGDEYLRLYAAGWRWMEGARAAFMRIAARHPVGLMTNGFTEVQKDKIVMFDVLAHTCDHILISEEVGVLKPDIRLFKHAEDLCGYAGHHVLIIGDSLSSDVTGGVRAGWQVAWFRGGDHDSRQVWSFHDWAVLEERLAV